MEGDEDGGMPAFLANEDLEDGSTRVRAPTDDRPYDDGDDASYCFASAYTPDDDEDPANLGAGELRDAFQQMHTIIDRHYSKNTSLTDLVDAVYDFYENRIRRAFDYGHWSKKSIYRYVVHHSASSEDRQSTEGIKLLWSNIEFMRDHTGILDERTGKTTPDLRMIKALSDALKLHSCLVNERRKRPKATA